MAGETNPREIGAQKKGTWKDLFRTFTIALDPLKLLVAAVGLLLTAIGWWLISVIFYYSFAGNTPPTEDDSKVLAFKELSNDDIFKWEEKEKQESYKKLEGEELKKRKILVVSSIANEKFKAIHAKRMANWALWYELAGPTERANEQASKAYAFWYQSQNPDPNKRNADLAKGFGGKYRQMPWVENRGPNPFLMIRTVVSGSGEQRREVLTWFASNQLPNLIEPLLKFFTPVYYLFDERANSGIVIYLIFLILWLVGVWGFFGGIITRMAALSLANKEGGGLRGAVKWVKDRYFSYLISPMVPLGIIAFIVLCCIVFGLLHWIPGVGDILVSGLFWWLPLIAGIVMTLVLLGLVGYPMMYTTLSTEGTDTFDAVSRTYSYVFESPWHYLWYSLVAILYGAVLTLFVVSVGSLSAYFAKWGVAKFPFLGERSPEYLFIYAPESLGWKQVLLANSSIAVNDDGEYIDPELAQKYISEYAWYNHAGAGMVSFWVALMFLLVIGFSYSYFWTASTQIYLLMRQRVDGTEVDDVTLEVAPPTPVVPAPATPASAPTPTPTEQLLPAPTLKTPEPSAPPTPSSEPIAPTTPQTTAPTATEPASSDVTNPPEPPASNSTTSNNPPPANT
jgi:hypothetical protein